MKNISKIPCVVVIVFYVEILVFSGTQLLRQELFFSSLRSLCDRLLLGECSFDSLLASLLLSSMSVGIVVTPHRRSLVLLVLSLAGGLRLHGSLVLSVSKQSIRCSLLL